jgi:cell division septum initiation protein DivIVA
MLVGKGDLADLGVNWVQKWLNRHPQLKSKYIPPLDKQRAMAQDGMIVRDYFQLFADAKAKYKVEWADIYNMDEKGVMMGVIGEEKVVISATEKGTKSYITQDGSREWSTLISCISGDGRYSPLYAIFKGIKHNLQWLDHLPEGGAIALSANGWTDNIIGADWFKRIFEPWSRKTQKGEYRMVLFDGHSSHISSEVINFCVKHKIVLLCLPPHTTHFLQPLDVSLFAPLSTHYKRILRNLTEFQYANYAIDKIDFLKVISSAIELAFTPKNISSGWSRCGLNPFNPEEIIRINCKGTSIERQNRIERQAIQEIGETDDLFDTTQATTQATDQPTTPSREYLHTLQTPANIAQIDEAINLIDSKLKSLSLDIELALDLQQRLKKIKKGSGKVFAQVTTTQHNFDAILKAQKTKEQKKQRKNKDTLEDVEKDGARILDADYQEARREYKRKQELEKEIDIFFKNIIWPYGTYIQQQDERAQIKRNRPKRPLTLWQIEKAEQEEISLRLWAELPFSEAPIAAISSKSLSKSPSKSPSKLRSKSPSKSPSKRPSAETEPLKQVHFSLSTTIDLLYPSEPSEPSNISSNPTKLHQSKPQNRNKRKVVQPEGKSTSDKVEIRTSRGRVIKKTEKARGI